MRIHILGASGSGTTTLGGRVSRELGCRQFDSDDYFWLKTEVPFTQKRPVDERRDLLMSDLHSCSDWVLSGCKNMWQDAYTDDLYDLVIFLYVPEDVRMARLKKRETGRFGKDAIEPGGYFHDDHNEFMDWAGSYDREDFDGRSKAMHEELLESFACPVLRLEGDSSADENLLSVLKFIEHISERK
jgi:adenylate kinase family enzyme